MIVVAHPSVAQLPPLFVATEGEFKDEGVSPAQGFIPAEPVPSGPSNGPTLLHLPIVQSCLSNAGVVNDENMHGMEIDDDPDLVPDELPPRPSEIDRALPGHLTSSH
jgi:hypothetical protein